MATGPGDTGWQPVTSIVGSEDAAKGKVQMATGLELKPCFTCRSFEDPGLDKMVQHLGAHGLELQTDGTFKTPIAKEIPGRQSLTLDPKDFGFCRLEVHPVDRLATCPSYVAVKRLSDFQRARRGGR